MHRQDEYIAQEHKQQHDAVTECCQRQQQRGGDAVFTGFQPADEHPEAQNRKSECDRKRELPRHGRRNIAAIDGEALIKEKHGCTNNHQFRQWIQQFADAPNIHRHRLQKQHLQAKVRNEKYFVIQ
mgnify:CR=1 FL=1